MFQMEGAAYLKTDGGRKCGTSQELEDTFSGRSWNAECISFRGKDR